MKKPHGSKSNTGFHGHARDHDRNHHPSRSTAAAVATLTMACSSMVYSSSSSASLGEVFVGASYFASRSRPWIVPRGGGASSSSSISPGRSRTNPNRLSKVVHSKCENRTEISTDDDVVSQILQRSDHYDVLGVSRTATNTDITRAYRRCAVLTHPDKLSDGDRRAFDKVSEAYHVLGNEEARALYDRFGTNDLFVGMGVTDSAEDVLRSFFFREKHFPSGVSTRKPTYPKNCNVQYHLEVTLEDLYNGISKTVLISSNRRSPCELNVTVDRGMDDGQSITLPGTVEDVPYAPPADRVFVLKQQRHPVFVRKGYDIMMEAVLSSKEAVCGFERTLFHLDGRMLQVRGPQIRRKARASSLTEREEKKHDGWPPVLVRTGDVHVLKGEGMPRRNRVMGIPHLSSRNRKEVESRSEYYGDLYVKYKVEAVSSSLGATTDNLTVRERKELGRLLDKLEGGDTSSSSTPKIWNYSQSSIYKHNDIDMKNCRYLRSVSPSDFGMASDPLCRRDQEDGILQDTEGKENEAGNMRTFIRNGKIGCGSGVRYNFSSNFNIGMDMGGDKNPFRFTRGSAFHGDEDDMDQEDVHCRQM